MQLAGFDRFVWAAAFYGHLLLLLVLFARHRARSFPVFTFFVAENIARTIVLYLVFYHLSFETYRTCYWLLDMADDLVQLLVVYELAAHVFRPTGVWARDVHKVFLGAIGVGTLVALLLTFLANPSVRLHIQTLMVRTAFFNAVLMAELFVTMVALSATAGLPWKTHVARIAQGLGAFSIISVATETIINYVGLKGRGELFRRLSHLQIVAYLVCEAFWIVMLWLEAPAPRELPESLRTQIYILQKRVEYDLIKIRTWRGN